MYLDADPFLLRHSSDVLSCPQMYRHPNRAREFESRQPPRNGGTPTQMLALPAFHCAHGMFQSPSPSVPGNVEPTVWTISTMSPRLELS
jgi:hypothetical protein